ncbi:MAG: hypothetical protein EOP83_11225 [Verrucomicrobiaceae bacterium]|nr:MAG: hypothetical protein EOP83_11225 [Verrucomicrobiaceae bacterium]
MNAKLVIMLMAALTLTACDDRAERKADKERSLKAVYNAGREMDEARRRADRPEATSRDHEAYRTALDRLGKRKQDAVDAGVENWKVESEALAASVDATSERTARTLAEAKRRDARKRAEEEADLK